MTILRRYWRSYGAGPPRLIELVDSQLTRKQRNEEENDEEDSEAAEDAAEDLCGAELGLTARYLTRSWRGDGSGSYLGGG